MKKRPALLPPGAGLRAMAVLLAVLVLSAAMAVVPALAQECGNVKPSPQATEDCQHGSLCANSTCVCTSDYASKTCGWPSADSCDCLACLNGGYMSNNQTNDQSYLVHQCVCTAGWTGRNCDLCSNVQTCASLYPESEEPICDNTPIVINYKVFDCAMGKFEVTPFNNASARVQFYRAGLDTGNGTGHFQLWSFVTFEMREIFYCDVEQCSSTGGEEEYVYSCEKTDCYFTGHLHWSDPWINIVENELKGLSTFTCQMADATGNMACDLYQNGLRDWIETLELVCFSGECSSEPRPIVEQPVNYRGIVATSVVAALIIFVVMAAMYFYQRHQKKYYSFKGIDGKAIQFMTLGDSGVQFSGDVLLFDNVSYVLGDKTLLNDVEGLALPGQVLAIIGASGAGKTTLLDILAQRLKRGKVTGSILLNGQPIEQSFSRVSSYVDQEPAAIGTLTVREMLMTAAQLRLPEVVSTQQKKERIQSLAHELGIEHILDRRYGESGDRGISGGEKRRVQIACQLVTGPSVVFLDEPTSGLDAFNAMAVCRFLKEYASRKNRTVIMSIHQPRSDIFYTFDRLLVLGDGFTIFYGETKLSKQYFESLGYSCPSDFNPADFILDVTMSDKDKLFALHEQFLQSEFYKKYQHERRIFADGFVDYEPILYDDLLSKQPRYIKADINFSSSPDSGNLDYNGMNRLIGTNEEVIETAVPIETDALLGHAEPIADGYKDMYATSWFTQVAVLSGRSFADMYRYPLLLRMHMLFAIASGLLIGVFFFNLTLDFAGTQNRIGLLLFILIVLAFGSMSSIGFMNRERDQFAQERASGAYMPSAFFIVKVFYDLVPLRIIPSAVLGLLVYYLTGLQNDPSQLAHFLLIIILFNSTTSLICLAISTIVRNTSLANLVAIITLLFFLLFQNALINLDALPLYISWITFLSPFRFALNSIMVNEFDGLLIYFDPYGMEPTYLTGRSILTLFAFHPEWAYSVDIYVLLGMIGGWFMIGMICLYVFVRELR